MSNNKRPAPFTTLSSQIVWSSPWYSVRQDQIRLPDGRPGVYNVVQHPGAVWIIPLTAAGDVILLYHYRYTVDDWCWEIPAGGLKDGLDPKQTARVELREEIGATDGELRYFGHFYTANGISNEVAHIFIAHPVTPGPTHHEPAEVMQVHRKPLDEVLRMARANEISDGPTALALLLCEPRLRALTTTHPASSA
ncbi:MAG: NUDIX hydrolase [Candidatus Promineifilaceae bacterium]|nr:NUDIX hydrolase [Candidatus Promineifilaceae bacterium]